MSQRIWDLVSSAYDIDPAREYCTFDGRSVTVADLAQHAAVLSRRLADRGITVGSKVAVMLPNSINHIYLIFALAHAGAVYVPINTRANGPGLRHMLSQVEPDLAVVDSSVLDTFAAATEQVRWHGPTVPVGDGYRTGIFDWGRTGSGPDGAGGPCWRGTETAVTPADLVCISYTSGTTGPPKGVQLTDRMLRGSAEGVRRTVETRPGDRMLVWEPFYHLGGHQMLLFALLEPVSLAILPRFSASAFWDEARRTAATHIHYLGGILQLLLRQPAHRDDRHHRVRLAWGAGATVDVGLEFSQRFGVPVREVYGLTESSSINTINFDGRPGSMGWPTAPYSAQVVAGDRTQVGIHQVGELRLRTADPGLFTPGYFKSPEATARLLPGDGWLYTGDAVRQDEDGRLYFVGRLTDNVRVRGENVSAWEVETAVKEHPDVADCAMVGVASEFGEQDIKVFVERTDGSGLTEAELSAWCDSRLARHQRPRYISWIDGFDRGPSMRILKHNLSRDPAGCWDRLAAADIAAT